MEAIAFDSTVYFGLTADCIDIRLIHPGEESRPHETVVFRHEGRRKECPSFFDECIHGEPEHRLMEPCAVPPEEVTAGSCHLGAARETDDIERFAQSHMIESMEVEGRDIAPLLYFHILPIALPRWHAIEREIREHELQFVPGFFCPRSEEHTSEL